MYSPVNGVERVGVATVYGSTTLCHYQLSLFCLSAALQCHMSEKTINPLSRISGYVKLGVNPCL